MVKSYQYDEYGKTLGERGSVKNTYLYTGQELDGKPMYAYNLRAREYYPSIGRFLQNDPIGNKGGSLNWYLYMANNPINATDPLGLKIYECTRGIHRYFKVNDESWGFNPDRNMWQFPNWGTVVPGIIKHPEVGGTCNVIKDDDYADKCVRAVAEADRKNPPNWSFYYNCISWRDEVFKICNVK